MALCPADVWHLCLLPVCCHMHLGCRRTFMADALEPVLYDGYAPQPNRELGILSGCGEMRKAANSFAAFLISRMVAMPV
jgi:hypothetical protein